MSDEQPPRAASRRGCARCSWRPAGDESRHDQAVEHAEQSGHPLCVVCTRSLTSEEPTTCERCLGRTRDDLRAIVELYALLPEQIGHPATQVYDRSGRSSDGSPLPGGDALVLLARGGTGTTARRLTPLERLAAEKPGVLVAGREHAVDNKEDDGASIAYALANWETYWRELRDEPIAVPEQWWLPDAVGPLTVEQMAYLANRLLDVGPTVATSAGYLERRMRWAADVAPDSTLDPDFVAFAQDLRQMRQQLEALSSTGDRELRAPVRCFDCDARALTRQYRPSTTCEHTRPDFAEYTSRIHRADIPRVLTPKWRLLLDFEHVVNAWDSRHEATCTQGGLVEHWTCARCHREYTEQEYRLVLARQMKTDSETRGWLTPSQTATSLAVPVNTVRTWLKRLQVTSMCDVKTRRMHVWWPDAHDLHLEQAARRAELEARRAEREQRGA